MAPTTTLAGAGHNPPQSLAKLCGLSADIEAQVNVASNYQRTQNMLEGLCGSGQAFEFPNPGKPRFGGFFFGIRAPEVYDLEDNYGNLFNANNPLFGQEGDFVKGMVKMNLNFFFYCVLI